MLLKRRLSPRVPLSLYVMRIVSDLRSLFLPSPPANAEQTRKASAEQQPGGGLGYVRYDSYCKAGN